MAKRYSGKAVVTVTWVDRIGAYKATVSVGKRNVWSGTIGAPRHLSGSVDSPKSYDAAAHAALSFAMADGADVDAVMDRGGYEMHVGRSAATKWPKQENPRKRARKAAPKRKRPVRKPAKRAKARKRSSR